jgi:lipoyl(octanoyl) transferase
LQPYEEIFARMRDFTDARGADTPDELWSLQHAPVFTQGQAGRAEHILAPGDIPVVQTDRGGQVTYHGPGQVVIYVLADLGRLGIGIRTLVTRLEDGIVRTLQRYGIRSSANPEAPGVYVDGAKIASLGLRVRRNCTYHGIALNVAMDLEPFARINPCGYENLAMTQVRDLGGPGDTDLVADDLLAELVPALGYV